MQLGSGSTPTRTRRPGDAERRNERVRQSNAWERGVPVDSKGMPFLDENLRPVGIKTFTERRREWDQPGREVSKEAVDTVSGE